MEELNPIQTFEPDKPEFINTNYEEYKKWIAQKEENEEE